MFCIGDEEEEGLAPGHGGGRTGEGAAHGIGHGNGHVYGHGRGLAPRGANAIMQAARRLVGVGRMGVGV